MPRDSLVGQVLGGRYRVDEIVGQGGMSAVYKAYDRNLKRVVAIKTIHTHLANDPRFLVRFEEEATAVAQLRHPNIVQVFDFNHDGDLYYMVQEFVAGETLQERLRRLGKAGKPMPLVEAIGVALSICEAAGYAHRRGMIHRDIKPANIMLGVQGQAILMDFGIVKITGAEHHTTTGAVVGTALYMPPELIQGEAPDARSDLYSLGVTLYEMVSGRPPFEADSFMTLMKMHLQDPVPDLRALRSGMPEVLVAVIEKSLAKSRDDRYHSMADLAAALRHALVGVEAVSLPGAAVLEQPQVPAAHDAPLRVTPAARERAASAGPGGLSAGGEGTWLGTPGLSAAAERSVREPRGAAAPAAAAVQPARAEGMAPGRPAGISGEGQPGWASGPAPTERRQAKAGPTGRWPVSLALRIGGAVLVLAIVAGGLFGILRSASQDHGLPTAAAQSTDGSQLATLPTAAPATLTQTSVQVPAAIVTTTAVPLLAVPVQGPLPVPTVSPGVPYARIKGISLDSMQRYVVEYEAFEFTEKLPGMHLHFFFNPVPPERAGKPGEGLWTDYGGPRPFAQIKQSERPENASQMCVLVANADHSVQLNSGTCSTLPDVVAAVVLQDVACLAGPAEGFPVLTPLTAGQVALVRGVSPDEGWWNVADPQKLDEMCWLPIETTQVSGNISTVPLVEGPPLPAGAAPGGLSVEIQGITMGDQGRYVVKFLTTGFSPQLPGTHIHFFFDSVLPEQAGISGGGLRRMHGGPSPFTGYLAADRPVESGRMCALVANPDHSVLLGSGNCLILPDAP